MRFFFKYYFFGLLIVIGIPLPAQSTASLYRWTSNPLQEEKKVHEAFSRLNSAIKNPEFMREHWIDLPTAPENLMHKTLKLKLREAILLALRYNPNIQNAELDRIIQRYQLRLAHNEFELQYALAGTASVENTRYSSVGNTMTHNYMAAPEINLKNKYGGQLALNLDNNIQAFGNYNPLINLSFTQPLLRGFNKTANETSLLNAEDNEWLNKLNLKQATCDQITRVIGAYRTLILSANNLETQRLQLKEAQHSYELNEKKITAGQLEPTANIQQSYQIESLHLMVEQAENEFKTSAQDLLQTIGLDPNMHLSVPSDIQINSLAVPDVKEAINKALSQNAQYLALKVALKADERAYLVAKDQQLWQLDFNANVQAGNINNVDSTSVWRGIYNGNSLIESAGVTVTIPLHDLNRRNQLISAKVRLEKDRLNLIAAKRSLITTIKNTINTIASQAKRYELAKRQVHLATQAYELEKKKQQAGISSALDVNNTQNQLIHAQMGLIGAKISYLNQMSSLEQLLGITLDRWKIKMRYGES